VKNQIRLENFDEYTLCNLGYCRHRHALTGAKIALSIPKMGKDRAINASDPQGANRQRAIPRVRGARIGISGWRYKPWRGDFYPVGLPQDRELAFAAERFDSIELNGSFYSLQRPESYERWYGQVPAGFVFAIKGSRYITHMLRLEGVETALANLLASGVFALREKIGPFLWQLPPTMACDEARLAKFFALLPRTGEEAAARARLHDKRVKGRTRLDVDPRSRFRHALEVRHATFVTPTFIALLREHGIGLVVADTAGKWPLLEDVTADFVYARLHGDAKLYESGYTPAALDRWADKIDAWLDGREPPAAHTIGTAAPQRGHRDVFVYFDNDVKVRAPYDAMSLATKVAARRRPGRAEPPREAGATTRRERLGT
jgi:uncharacterized protein YecE (DUF72 family)